MEEQELALRCARKDKAAQRELYEEYRSRILALCRRYAVNPADAEDMMHDAFIKIFKTIGKFKWTRPGSLYSWMSRVSINLAFDTAKRRKRLASQLTDMNNMGDDIPEEPVYDETVSVPSEVLKEMIESLPEGYRTVFLLYCIDGLSHREIAELLGIKEKSSSASLFRARTMLAGAIRQYWRYLDNGSSEEWLHIQRKMRRADTARKIKLILAILIPMTSLLLWLQPSHNHNSATQYFSQLTTDKPSVIIPYQIEKPCEIDERITVIINNSSDIQDNISESSNNISEISYDIPDIQNDTSDVRYEEEDSSSSRLSPKISFSFRAGSGSSIRNTQVSLKSSPYIAALIYMNSVDPSCIPNAKSNSSNAIPWYIANSTEVLPPETTNYYQHDLPVTFGITARLDLTSKIGAECGIEYTYMHSNIETTKEQLSQNMHFIGIPVRFDTHVWSWNGFDIYAGIGVKVEKCVAASLGLVKCEEKRLQWSADTFAGIQHKIGRRAHLYFQPDLSYYITKTDLITYRTENPLTFSMNAGIRFDL